MGLFQNQENFASKSLEIAEDVTTGREFLPAQREIAGLSETELQARDQLRQRAAGGFGSELATDVISQTNAELARQAEIQRQQVASRAAKAGAFGGSRFGVAEGEIGRNLLDIQGRTAAGLNLQAAGLGEQLSRQREQDLLSVGGLERGLSQAELDATRQENLREFAFPEQQLALRTAALGGIPLAGQVPGIQLPTSGGSSLLDIIQGGVGIAQGIGAVSQTPFGQSIGSGISSLFDLF